MTKWEYHVQFLSKGARSDKETEDALELELKRLGTHGWELVHISDGGCAFLKRPQDLSGD